MTNNLYGSRLAGGNSSTFREKNDYYATDPKDTSNFLNKYLSDNNYFKPSKILEPAAGEGHITKVLKKFFPDSEIVSVDLIDRGVSDIFGNIDFINSKDSRVNQSYDLIITNPPFKIMKEFIDKALTLSKHVMMFGKLVFLEGVKRTDWFEKGCLKNVYVYSYRANPWKNGEPKDPNGNKWSSTMAFAWFEFELGYKGKPQINFITK